MPELVDAARPRLAARRRTGRRGAAITVTAGTLDAIERLLTVHLRPGDAVAVEDPGWANLFDLLAALGLACRRDGGGRRGPAARRRWPPPWRPAHAPWSSPTRAQNPTGAAVSAERAAALRSLLVNRPERAGRRGRPRRRAGRCAAALPRPGHRRLGVRPVGVQAVRPRSAHRGAGRRRDDHRPGGRPDADRQRLGVHHPAAAAAAALAGRDGHGHRSPRRPRAMRQRRLRSAATRCPRAGSRPTAPPASTSGYACRTRPGRSAPCAMPVTRSRPGRCSGSTRRPASGSPSARSPTTGIEPLADAVAGAAFPVASGGQSR